MLKNLGFSILHYFFDFEDGDPIDVSSVLFFFIPLLLMITAVTLVFVLA